MKNLSKIEYKKRSLLIMLIMLVAVIAVNMLFSNFFTRIDLTKEKRFTISESSKEILRDLNDVMYVQIFLHGDLPADYRRLRNALRDMLEEYRIYSGNRIEYDFIDPFKHDNEEEKFENLQYLRESGLNARQVRLMSVGESKHKNVIPGAIFHYHGRELAVNFLPEQFQSENIEAVISTGISTLEYNLSNSIVKVVRPRNKRVAFLQGHGELRPREMADFLVTLQSQQYDIDFIDLNEVTHIPEVVDVVVVPKPTKPFEEKNKFKIDQYLMSGGKMIWAIDGVTASMDSLRGRAPSEHFLSRDNSLNLEDQLFQYGVRINKDIIQDEFAAPIGLMTQTRERMNFVWPFFPLVSSNTEHSIVKHLDPVITKFPSSIDTTSVPDLKKTVLLHSSNLSRVMFNPVRIGLESAIHNPTREQLNRRYIPVAVLLEGEFKSIFRNRPTQEFLATYQDSLGLRFREQSPETKIIVISDGDILRNELSPDGSVMPLGFYRENPGVLYGNKTFLLNSIDYLTDNYGIVETRTKDFRIRPLDRERLSAESLKWQTINLGIPVIFIILFAGIYNIVRRKKYTS